MRTYKADYQIAERSIGTSRPKAYLQRREHGLQPIHFSKTRGGGVIVRRFENIWQPSYILIDVAGKTIKFKKELKEITEEIEASKYMLSLEKGWDDNNAVPVPKATWSSAIKFLSEYVNYIFENFNIIIKTPEINPCPNGSVDIAWRTKKARFLANVRVEGNKMLVFYYGDLYKGDMPIKGFVPVSPIQTYLVNWMPQNLI